MIRINTDPNKGTTYLDKHNMIVYVGNPLSKRDAIGKNVIAMYAYPDYISSLIIPIRRCFKVDYDSNQVIAHRYPYEEEGEDFHFDTSRDHVNYALSGLTIFGHKDFAIRIIKNLKRPSPKFKFTRGGKIWMKSLYRKGYARRFPINAFTSALIVVVLNKFFRLIGGFEDRLHLHDYLFDKKYNFINRSKYKKLISYAIYPTYAMFYRAMQLNAVKQTSLIRLTKRILLLDVEKSNYVLRYFLDDVFTGIEVYRMSKYKPTGSFRWTTRLDESNDRNLDLVNFERGDNLEYDILKTIYEKLNKNDWTDTGSNIV